MGIIFSQGSGVNNDVFGKSQEPIKMFLEKKVETFEKLSVVDKIFAKENSKNYAEKYSSMSSMNGFEPTGEGGAYPQDEMQEGFSKIIENETWKDKFVITQEMVEDSKVIDFKKKPTAFINGYNRTKEQFGAALLGGAIASPSVVFRGKKWATTSADNKSVFATDHPSKVKGPAQSNKFSNAFSDDALAMMESAMQDFRDDNKNVLAITPDTIIVPNIASLKKSVFAAVGADKDPNTANNGFNFLFGRWRIIVWQYLNQFIQEGTAPWILLDSTYNEENKTAVWQNRLDLTVKSYIDENTDNNVWAGRARFAAGFNDWRGIAVGGVADGTTLA